MSGLTILTHPCSLASRNVSVCVALCSDVDSHFDTARRSACLTNEIWCTALRSAQCIALGTAPCMLYSKGSVKAKWNSIQSSVRAAFTVCHRRSQVQTRFWCMLACADLPEVLQSFLFGAKYVR